jgi:hypothetical protein
VDPLPSRRRHTTRLRAPCRGLARCFNHNRNNWPAVVGWQRQPGHHAREGLAVGEPRLGPAQVLVHDYRRPAGGDSGVFCLAHLISNLSPSPSLLGAHGFHIGNKGVQAQASGNTRAAMATVLGPAKAREDGIRIAAVITTWGGRCPLSIGWRLWRQWQGRRMRQE